MACKNLLYKCDFYDRVWNDRHYLSIVRRVPKEVIATIGKGFYLCVGPEFDTTVNILENSWTKITYAEFKKYKDENEAQGLFSSPVMY